MWWRSPTAPSRASPRATGRPCGLWMRWRQARRASKAACNEQAQATQHACAPGADLSGSISANHAAAVNIDPSGQQVLINWKNLKQICVRQVVDAVCDIPHRWTIYLSVLCRTEFGERYHKSIEVAPQGNYRAEHLTDVSNLPTWTSGPPPTLIIRWRPAGSPFPQPQRSTKQRPQRSFQQSSPGISRKQHEKHHRARPARPAPAAHQSAAQRLGRYRPRVSSRGRFYKPYCVKSFGFQ